MSREEVAAHLRNLQLSLDGLQRELEGRIAALPSTKRDELPAALAGVRVRLACFTEEQLREMDDFAAQTGLELEDPAATAEAGASAAGVASGWPAAGGNEAGTPLAYQLRSLERRVAGMGGIPALGACVLPRTTPGTRPQLNATASPAAVEIMRGRLGGSDADATPLRKTSSGEVAAAPTPLVQLRQTPHGVKGGASPLGGASPNSELAAAIQRRMQRLASASPEKESAMAAAATATEAAA